MAGQIIARGKNTWLVRVFLGRDPQTGKRQYQNHTIHGGKKDAQEYLNKTLTERDKGLLTIDGGTTIDKLLDMLVLDYKVNGKSVWWAEMKTNRLREPFGKLKPSKLTSQALQNYMAARLAEGIANATINRELALLRRALKLGAEATPPLVTKIPKFPTLEENNVRKGFFEDAEYRALFQELPSYLKPVLAFAYYTGCRKGEILGLRWAQVDLNRKLVRLEAGETKNDEPRVIPMVSELHQLLSMQRARRDAEFPACEWVFFGETGDRIRNFRYAWDMACTRAKIIKPDGKPARLFHDLRRTGVRNLVRAGVPDAVAMKISGHKTRAVFDRYNIVSERDLLEAATKLEGFMADSRQKPVDETRQEANRHTIGTQSPNERTH